MAGRSFPTIALVLVALPFLVPAVLGMGVVTGPESIVEGGAITVSLTNVTNGTRLNTTLTASFPPAEGITWFNLSGWNYPFALQKGMGVVSGQNVNQIVFLIRTGNTYLMRRVTGTGNIAVEIPLEFQPATVYDFRIGYEVHSAKDPLVFTLIQEGFKAGTETDANLTPSLAGIGNGDVKVSVFGNGTFQGGKEIQVSLTAPLPTPRPVDSTMTPSETPSPVEKPPGTTQPEMLPPGTTPPSTTPPVTAPAAETPPGTTPSPARVSPVVTTPVATQAPAGGAGPSPFVLVYAGIIIITAVVGDYLLLKD